MIYYGITFIMMTTLYLYTAIKKNKLINIMFYKYLNLGITMVFFHTLYLSIAREYFEIDISDIYLIVYCWLSYIGCTCVTLKKNKNEKLERMLSFRKKKFPSNFVIISMILIFCGYWIINYQLLFTALKNPRLFYTSTRLGGGIIYYVILPIGMFLFVYFISSIDATKNINMLKIIFFVVLFGMFFYLFGQKAKIVSLMVYTLSIYSVTRKRRDVNKKIFKYGIVFAIVILAIFSLYFAQQGIKMKNIMTTLINYSDYVDNFKKLVLYHKDYQYGKIFFEDEFYSYIPRALWKGKPELFGSLRLGLEVPALREWTLAKTGAPSFGPIGSYYADFGVIGIFVAAIVDILFAKIAVFYDQLLEKNGFNIFNYLMLMTFVGYAPFSLTLTKIPLYQVFVTILVYKASRYRLIINKGRKRSA